jgi:hypothetical protein
MRTTLATLVLLALAGCAGQSQEATTARNVCSIAYGDPALDPVRGRIPFEDDAAARAAMNYLADPDKPNAAERAALQQFDAANRRCWDAWDKAGTSAYVQSARAKVSAALGELYSGKSTYGDFNRARGTAIAEMRAAAAEAGRAGTGGPGGGSPFTFGVGLGIFR